MNAEVTLDQLKDVQMGPAKAKKARAFLEEWNWNEHMQLTQAQLTAHEPQSQSAPQQGHPCRGSGAAFGMMMEYLVR